MFILVTLSSDGEQIILNANAVQTIEQSTTGSIIFFSAEDRIEVRESIEQLYDMLRKEHKK